MGLQRDRLQTIEGWHSTTELDTGHLLSPSGLPPPTKMLQVPPAQGASDPVVPVGVLKLSGVLPHRGMCSKENG